MPIGLIDIPFSEWQKNLVSGDFSIYGEDASRLVLEWKEATETARDKALININCKVEHNRYMVLWLQLWVDLLVSNGYNADFAAEIETVFPNIQFTKDNTVESIEKTVTLSKRFVTEFEQAVIERDEMMKQYSSGGSVDLAYYSSITNSLSKHYKIYIPDDINTQRWACLYKEYVNDLESERIKNAMKNAR